MPNSRAREVSDAELRAELAAMSYHELVRALPTLNFSEARELVRRWEMWALEAQIEPAGDWRVWMIRAGRGFGKTRAGAEWVSAFARTHARGKVALVGHTMDDVRRVMVEGESGLIAVAREDEPVRWHRSNGVVEFANGAEATLFSAEAPEKLRGPEHAIAWVDELAKWRTAPGMIAWDNLMMSLRGGERPRVLVTTTPRPTPLVRRVMATKGYVETLGRTRDNTHLPTRFVEAMVAEYGGTRMGRQELDGELIDDVANALWTRALIEGCRVASVPPLVRVIVGVDPPAGDSGDACGIVAAGIAADGTGYVIEDASVAGASPGGWAAAVAGCAERVGADRVVAEANNGGHMVEAVLRGADHAMPVRRVHASKGKVARAEPVAALYEKRRVRHAGAFPALEDELCGLIAGGGYEGPGRSPDRADALVWALTELMLKQRRVAGVRRL